MFEHDGRYWMIGANTGKWYVHDGENWLESDPPRMGPSSLAASAPESRAAPGPATAGASAGESFTIVLLGDTAHGKTALAAALNKVLALSDRTRAPRYQLADPPARGNDLDQAIARMPPPDAAIVVVASVPGPTPRTADHVRLARQRGIESIVVFLNLHDAVADPELIDLEENEVRQILSRHGYASDRITVVRGNVLHALASTSSDQGAAAYAPIVRLVQALDSMAKARH